MWSNLYVNQTQTPTSLECIPKSHANPHGVPHVSLLTNSDPLRPRNLLLERQRGALAALGNPTVAPMGKRGASGNLKKTGSPSKPVFDSKAESFYNGELNDNVERYKNLICEHNVFKNIFHETALEIRKAKNDDSGFTAPFSTEMASLSLRSRGKYDCGFNFWHLDPLSKVDVGVATNMGKVEAYTTHYLEEPDELPGRIVGLIEKKDIDKIPSVFGSISVASPIEPRHAIILRVGKLVESGASNEELLPWARVFKTVSVRLMICEDRWDRIYLSIQLRQHIAQDYHSMSRSPAQTIMEIGAMKGLREKSLGRLNFEAFAKDYNAHVKQAADGQGEEAKKPIDAEFVRKCCDVNDKANTSR